MSANLLPFDGEVVYLPCFFKNRRADALFAELDSCLDWTQETATLFGRAMKLPRLTAWYGPTSYSYSGVTHAARPFPETVAGVARSLGQIADGFNCVLANRYRDGSDSVSWHSDNEALWGDQPIIASVSFGAARFFTLRHRSTGERVRVELEHGSVLVMRAMTQRFWLHTLPKTVRSVGPRINLTFRRLERLPG